jgi:F-type H+-transporting ATPase subunit b
MEILAKIGFDWQVALANFVNFLIIFYLLNRFLFGPISKTIAERKKLIAEGLQNAALATDALTVAKEEGDRIIAEARAQANTIISGVEKEGLALKARRAEEAEKEAAAILHDAEEKIAQEKSRLESDIKVKAVDVAILGAKTILKEEIDVVKHSAIVKEVIKTA